MNLYDNLGSKVMTVSMAQEITRRANYPRRMVDEHFDRVINMKIDLSARKGKSSCTEIIPPYTIGLPLYDAEAVRDILARTYEKRGWTVKAVDKSGITISWKPKPRKKVSFTS